MALDPTNATILDRVRQRGSNDYQQRIPEAGPIGPDGNLDGIERVQRALMDPNNGQLFNEFVRNLPVVIGTQKARTLDWRNPLAVFKKDYFADQKVYMEYAARLIAPHQYNPNDPGAVLRNHEVPVEALYHTVNRKVYYPVTVLENEIKKSFNNAVSGLNDYLSLMLQNPLVSNEYDEYRFMLETLAVANKYHPFYNVQVTFVDPANPTEEELKNLSRQIRTVGYQMKTAPTGQFNSMGLPSITQTNKLVLLIKPATLAALDVNVLADAFHIDRTDFANRTIVVDEIPLGPDVHAVLLDEDAIIAGDSLLNITTFYNPVTLSDNWYLHAHGGYSVSAFGNIAVFSNSASTQIGIVDVELTGIEASFENLAGDAVTTAHPGEQVKVNVVASGDIDPDNELFKVPNNFVTEIYVGTSDVRVSPRTFVNSAGYLLVGSDLAKGTVLTVKVISAYRNPSAPFGTPTTAVTDTVTLTVD